MIIRHSCISLAHGKHWLKKFLIRAITLFCVFTTHENVFASGTEYKIKAAYLYQFTKFTQWPNDQFTDNSSPIRICVLGRNPFGKLLENFSGKTSQQRSLTIFYLSSLRNLSSCHVVFISKSEKRRLPKILQLTRNTPVLTVSDIENFAPQGGIIGFVPMRKKVGITINVDASLTAGAKLSSKLLEVATLVQNRVEVDTP
ncbi:hypothetical protein MNBD_GAMMA11-2717 [hydrothermal vent metagenome]|uniref:Transmembrane protein n=1 Tax=hydrothermal vent metagenome TaxID=652676 RepID=A0A3B0X270_9ZZZZ